MSDFLLGILVVLALITLFAIGLRHQIAQGHQWVEAVISRSFASVDWVAIHQIGLIFLVLSVITLLFTVGILIFINWRRRSREGGSVWQK